MYILRKCPIGQWLETDGGHSTKGLKSAVQHVYRNR